MDNFANINYEIDIKIEPDEETEVQNLEGDFQNKGHEEFVEREYKSEDDTCIGDIRQFCFIKREEIENLPVPLDSLETVNIEIEDSADQLKFNIEEKNHDEDWVPKMKSKKLKTVDKKKRILGVSKMKTKVEVKHKPFQKNCFYNTDNKHDMNSKSNSDHEDSVNNNRACIKSKDGNNLKCAYCCYKASFPGNLKRHINEIHFKKQAFVCSFCNYQSTRKSHLDIHINNMHTKEKKYKCEFCDFVTFSPNVLNNHTNHLHTFHRWYECKLCKFKTTHSGNLKVHYRGMHDLGEKLICSYCSVLFDKRVQLRVHIEQKHERDKLKCNSCAFVAQTKRQLNVHIINKHPDQTKFSCKLCNYKAMSNATMQVHLYSKHKDGLQKEKYFCEDCCTYFKSSATLKRHQKVKHT